MFLRAQELTEMFIKNEVLTKHAISNICLALSIEPATLSERLTGVGFDGASEYAGKYNSVTANLRKEVPHLQGSHDRMHVLKLVLSDGLIQFPLFQSVLDIVADIYAYTAYSTKKYRKMQRLFSELHELSKQADLFQQRADQSATKIYSGLSQTTTTRKRTMMSVPITPLMRPTKSPCAPA